MEFGRRGALGSWEEVLAMVAQKELGGGGSAVAMVVGVVAGGVKQWGQAVGWRTCILLRMVAPLLVMMPSSDEVEIIFFFRGY